MHYVYLTDNVVTDQAQVDPYSIFYPEYASQFIEAPDEVTFNWSLVNGVWTAPPAPPAPTPEEIQAQNKSTATSLLQQTDWTSIPDVANPEYSDPYLMNQNEFLAYRSTVRNIAVNPPTTPAVFPTQPQEIWSN
jgi:hypothetical protein